MDQRRFANTLHRFDSLFFGNQVVPQNGCVTANRNSQFDVALRSHFLSNELLTGDYDNNYDFFLDERAGLIIEAIDRNVIQQRRILVDELNPILDRNPPTIPMAAPIWSRFGDVGCIICRFFLAADMALPSAEIGLVSQDRLSCRRRDAMTSTFKIQRPDTRSLIEKIKDEIKKRAGAKARRRMLKVPKRMAKR